MQAFRFQIPARIYGVSFLQFLQANVGVLSQIVLQPLPSTPFPIHESVDIIIRTRHQRTAGTTVLFVCPTTAGQAAFID